MPEVFKILSLDGGGTKGLFQAYLLRQFCIDAGIEFFDQNGNLDSNGDYCNLNKHVSLFSGTSIGAIAACAYACGYSPNFVIKFLTTYAPQIFTSAFGTPMPTWRKGICLGAPTIGGGIDCYNGDSFYGSGLSGNQTNQVMLQILTDTFGDTTLNQIKNNVLIPAVDITKRNDQSPLMRLVLLSNMLLPNLEGQKGKIVDTILASSAAPYYLPPRIIDQKTFIDGGLYQNNPAFAAYAYAYALNQGANIAYSLLSIGCGLSTVGFYDPNQPPPGGENIETNVGNNLTYGVDMLDISITGPQEATAANLNIFSKFNPNFYYLRYQTYFDPNLNTEVDNTGSEFQNYMLLSANNTYVLNKQKTLIFIQQSKYN